MNERGIPVPFQDQEKPLVKRVLYGAWDGTKKALESQSPEAWGKRIVNVIDTKIVPKLSPKQQQWAEEHKEGIREAANIFGVGITTGEIVLATVALDRGIRKLFPYRMTEQEIFRYSMQSRIHEKISDPIVANELVAFVGALIAAGVDPRSVGEPGFIKKYTRVIRSGFRTKGGRPVPAGIMRGQLLNLMDVMDRTDAPGYTQPRRVYRDQRGYVYKLDGDEIIPGLSFDLEIGEYVRKKDDARRERGRQKAQALGIISDATPTRIARYTNKLTTLRVKARIKNHGGIARFIRTRGIKEQRKSEKQNEMVKRLRERIRQQALVNSPQFIRDMVERRKSGTMPVARVQEEQTPSVTNDSLDVPPFLQKRTEAIQNVQFQDQLKSEITTVIWKRMIRLNRSLHRMGIDRSVFIHNPDMVADIVQRATKIPKLERYGLNDLAMMVNGAIDHQNDKGLQQLFSELQKARTRTHREIAAAQLFVAMHDVSVSTSRIALANLWVKLGLVGLDRMLT